MHSVKKIRLMFRSLFHIPLFHKIRALINTKPGVVFKQLIRINCLALVLCFSNAAYSANVHALKALFLFNFVNYVQWPTNTFKNNSTPVLYCVAGNLRVLKNLQSALKNEYFRGRKLKAIQVNSIAELKACHIVFFGASTQYQTASILETLSKQHVLTVGEDTEFLAKGGMINLNYIKNRIVIEINLSNVKQAQLKISSELLQLSKIK